jgi:DNA-binding MarR family transcriptional regulator
MSRYEEPILRSLRRMTRAIDLHSRRLATQHRLTGPQLVCLRAIVEGTPITPSALAREVSLSQATITGIVDRLVKRDLVERRRDDADRRRVLLAPTPAGQQTAANAPSPLQDTFAANLARLDEGDQREIADVLERVVRMMEAEDLDAAPLLATGPVSAPARQVLDLLEPDAS